MSCFRLCRFSIASLNAQVLQGPDLTNKAVGVLLRFREEPVALMADVEAMYHQLKVHPDDVDALRSLWYPDCDLTREPEEYHMAVHLFGGVWCLQFMIHWVLFLPSHYPPRLSSKISVGES